MVQHLGDSDPRSSLTLEPHRTPSGSRASKGRTPCSRAPLLGASTTLESSGCRSTGRLVRVHRVYSSRFRRTWTRNTATSSRSRAFARAFRAGHVGETRAGGSDARVEPVAAPWLDKRNDGVSSGMYIPVR